MEQLTDAETLALFDLQKLNKLVNMLLIVTFHSLNQERQRMHSPKHS